MKPKFTVKEATKLPTPDEAKEALKAEQEARQNTCSQEIGVVLKKHNCRIEVGMVVSPRGNEPILRIVAL